MQKFRIQELRLRVLRFRLALNFMIEHRDMIYVLLNYVPLKLNLNSVPQLNATYARLIARGENWILLKWFKIHIYKVNSIKTFI